MLLSAALDKVTRLADKKQFPDEISVDNLDEVKAHLKNELAILASRLEKALKSVNVELPNLKISETIKISNIGELGAVLKDIKSASDMLATVVEKFNFEPTVNVTVPDVIVPDIKIPDIKIPDIKVPEPKVIVNPNVEIDLSDLLKALEPLRFLSDRPDKPVSVRMSDGKAFIKALKNVADKAGQVVTAFSTSSGITKDEYKAAEGELYKGSTCTNNSASVGTSSTSVVAAKNRISIVLVNDSDTVIYVSKGATAVMNKGIRLNASGGCVAIEDWNGAISAICSGTGKVLCYSEVV